MFKAFGERWDQGVYPLHHLGLAGLPLRVVSHGEEAVLARDYLSRLIVVTLDIRAARASSASNELWICRHDDVGANTSQSAWANN